MPRTENSDVKTAETLATLLESRDWQKRLTILLYGLFVALVVGVTVSFLYAWKSTLEVDSLVEQQNTGLQAKKDDIVQVSESVETRINEHSQDLEVIYAKFSTLVTAISDSQSSDKQLRKKMRELKSQLEEQKKSKTTVIKVPVARGLLIKALSNIKGTIKAQGSIYWSIT